MALFDPARAVVDESWFMFRRADLQLVYMDPVVSNDAFGRYVEQVRRDFAELDGRPRGVLYDVPRPGVMTATRRASIAKILNEYRETLAEVTAGYALVTPSPVVRGVLAAIFWIAPPPYAHRIVRTVGQGFEFLHERLPSLDAARMAREYESLKSELLRRMAGGAGSTQAS